jgi:hypothetical protein
MGEAGRRHALEHYTVPQQADKLAAALREAAGRETRGEEATRGHGDAATR